MSDYHGRFSDLEWYIEDKPEVIIGGAGGIGSWLIFMLARIGYPMYLYEFDTIDETNMGGQLYPIDHVGKTKADSIVETTKLFSDYKDLQIMGKYKESSFAGPIMITCFDNMAGRKLMYENWKKQPNRELFIDGRMGPEHYEIYSVTPGLEEAYEATLFNDDEVEDLPCSAKATSHCGANIGSMITALLNNYVANTQMEGIRDIPFSLKVNLALMMFEQETVEQDKSITQ